MQIIKEGVSHPQRRKTWAIFLSFGQTSFRYLLWIAGFRVLHDKNSLAGHFFGSAEKKPRPVLDGVKTQTWGSITINHNDYLASLKSDTAGNLLICCESSVTFEEAGSDWTLTLFTCVFFQKSTEPSELSQIEYPPPDIREHSSFPPSVSPILIYTTITVCLFYMTHVTSNYEWVQHCFAGFRHVSYLSFPTCKYFWGEDSQVCQCYFSTDNCAFYVIYRGYHFFFFYDVTAGSNVNNHTIKLYWIVFLFSMLCEILIWIYIVAFQSEALSNVDKRQPHMLKY